MNNDRQVSLGLVSAVGCWIMTWVFLAAGTILGLTGHGDRVLVGAMSLLAHGLAMSAVAATVTIRCMLGSHRRQMEDAFRLGHEAGKVRQMSR